MAYSDFDLKKVRRDFGLQIDEQPDLCAHMLITPVLLDLWRQAQSQISLFSGTEFAVDEARGLTGYCDYILSRSKEQLTINAPVVMIVEAKNENIKGGLGQCVAEMIAAQLFNEREGNAIDTIYGVVTTGEIWKFLKLVSAVASIDLSDYYIVRDVPKILGVLWQGIGLPVCSTVEP